MGRRAVCALLALLPRAAGRRAHASPRALGQEGPPPLLGAFVHREPHRGATAQGLAPARGVAPAVGWSLDGAAEEPLVEAMPGAPPGVVLPATWLQGFAPGSAALQAPWGEGVLYAGTARWAAQPSLEVAFAARPTAAPGTFRDLFASRLLSGTGAVPAVLGSEVLSDVTFTLTESPGARSLAALLSESSAPSAAPRLPLERCVSLAVDVLLALEGMEESGLVHGDLTEERIFVLSCGHAVVLDFSSACAPEMPGPLGVEDVTLTGSAFRHAPEMSEGRPTGVENNMWQLGLVLARLVLGGDVATRAQLRHLEGLDGTAAGRQRIREAIRQDFAIQEMAEFKRLYPEHKDVLELIAGMLHKSPEHRWSVTRCLRTLVAIARERKLTLRAPRRPMALTADVQEAWQ